MKSPNVSLIIDNLYLSSWSAAKSLKTLNDLNIHSIVVCANELEPIFPTVHPLSCGIIE